MSDLISSSVSSAIVTPPLGIPKTISFVQIPLDGSASAIGGGVLQSQGNLVARIEGDTNGVFSILSIETKALIHPPDVPPSAGRAWQIVDFVDGAGPILVAKGYAVGVTVRCNIPATFMEQQVTATVVVAPGPTDPGVLSIPISATIDMVGTISMTVVDCPLLDPGATSGQTANLQVNVTSTHQFGVSGTFGLAPGAVGFTASPVRVSIPGMTTTVVTLPVTCSVGTPSGLQQNVPFLLQLDNGAGSISLPVTITVIYPILVSNHNYLLEENGNSLAGVTASILIDSDLISTANGWSMQLNTYSPSGSAIGMQQYIVYAGAGSKQLWARIDNFDSSLTEILRLDTKLATLPSATLPSGYTIKLALKYDSSGNVSGANYAVNDKTGKSLGTAAINIAGQILRTTGKPATAANTAPVAAMQMNIVADYGGVVATLTSGSGWITLAASKTLSAIDKGPSYINNQNGYTVETANLIYGPLPTLTSAAIVQSFQTTATLSKAIQLRAQALQNIRISGGHATMPPDTFLENNNAGEPMAPDPFSPEEFKKLRNLTKQRFKVE